jgi:hypothetical protein
MTIPKTPEFLASLQLLTCPLSIYHHRDLEDLAGLYVGSPTGDSIFIKHWGPSVTLSDVQVLLHEAIHAAEANYQIEGLSETQVDVLAAVMVTTLDAMDLLALGSDEDPEDSEES